MLLYTVEYYPPASRICIDVLTGDPELCRWLLLRVAHDIGATQVVGAWIPTDHRPLISRALGVSDRAAQSTPFTTVHYVKTAGGWRSVPRTPFLV